MFFAQDEVSNKVEYWRWFKKVEAFLDQAAPQLLTDFRYLSAGEDVFSNLAAQKGMLEGAALRLETETGNPPPAMASTVPIAAQQSKKVFVVHGHDSEAKEAVARFIERLGLEAIILHEQPNAGRTVIEKFEQYTDVGFAVVLLTPDDVGAAKNDSANPKPRARQNVVLELGYFLGKLKRSRVCALYKSGVEIPSDFDGVLYVELDGKGAWRTKLAQELSNARVPFNVDAILKI
ncbi:MAG TPA: nucleotide-binding protein [Terriglobales bacterium]|nr:nucleotide-binding protein [Terriglobales bacterium]